MNPHETQPTDVTPQLKTKRSRLGFVLIIGPTLLYIISVIIGFIATTTLNGGAGTENTPAYDVVNTIVFVAGAIAIASWLPCLIIGIRLLKKPRG